MATKCYGLPLDEKLTDFNITEAQLHMLDVMVVAIQ